MNLNQDRHQRIAELLANFSEDTIATVLARFDQPVQEYVRKSLPFVQSGGAETLNEFARFLYYHEQPEPDLPDSRGTAANGNLHTDPCPWEIEDIENLADNDLDRLLAGAPPEMTIAFLCCSRNAFVRRVLKRLADDQARRVARQINQSQLIQFDEMQSIQTRYCQFAFNLLNKEK